MSKDVRDLEKFFGKTYRMIIDHCCFDEDHHHHHHHHHHNSDDEATSLKSTLPIKRMPATILKTWPGGRSTGQAVSSCSNSTKPHHNWTSTELVMLLKLQKFEFHNIIIPIKQKILSARWNSISFFASTHTWIILVDIGKEEVRTCTAWTHASYCNFESMPNLGLIRPFRFRRLPWRAFFNSGFPEESHLEPDGHPFRSGCFNWMIQNP